MRALALIIVFCLAAPAAWAAECAGADGSVTVSVTPLRFNDYFASDPAADMGNFTVTAACAGGTDSPVLPPLSVALSSGLGGYDGRIMANGATTMSYQIYTDDTLINVWGDGSGGTALVSTGGGTAAQTFTGYGEIFGGQWVTVGSYVDSIAVTVSY
jgi:spore coat protein U-like protein